MSFAIINLWSGSVQTADSIDLTSIDKKLSLLSATVEAIRTSNNTVHRFSIHGAVIHDSLNMAFDNVSATPHKDTTSNKVFCDAKPSPSSKITTRSSARVKQIKKILCLRNQVLVVL